MSPGDGGWSDADQARFFAMLDEQSTTHWWHRYRRELVKEAAARTAGPPRRFVDVGCGVGTMVEAAAEAWPHAQCVGAEASLDALRRASARGRVVVAAAAEALPFADATADLVTSLDVVEHLDDDVAALREYARVMGPAATLVLTVPAYQWLWSDHDEMLGHRRRYTKAQLTRAVEDAGLTVVRTTYVMAFLVPAAILLRRTPLRRLVKGTGEEISYISPRVNRVFATICRLERWGLRRWNLPFGLTILLVARPAGEP